MANDFSKASFVAARRLYFEQIAANTNPPIDGRANEESLLKRNAFSENNLAETDIPSQSVEYHSSLRKSSSHSNLIPRKNERSKLIIVNNSKIPVPETHSPLIKSINVDIDENISSSISSKNYYNNVDSENGQPEDLINPTENLVFSENPQNNEIPKSHPIKPAIITSPSLKNSQSKLPLPTNHKLSQDNMNKSKENNNENISNEKENKGWFSFARDNKGWFAYAKEKVNSANSWLSMSRNRIDQITNFNGDIINESELENKNPTENINEIKENEVHSPKHHPHIRIQTQQRPKTPTQMQPQSPQLRPQTPTQMRSKSPQIRPITPTQMRPKSPQIRPKTPTQMRPKTPTQMRPKSPQVKPETPTQMKPKSPQIRPKTPTYLRSHSPQSRPVTPTQKSQQPSQSKDQNKPKSPSYHPAKVSVITQKQSFNNNEHEKIEIIENNKIPSTNEEGLKSPKTKPYIFNNTPNFIYKNTNLNLSNQSLTSTTSTTTNTEKLDDSNATMTGDELIIDDKELASTSIAFDKKVLQKIDNSLPQERNDNEVINKIQRKKRISFGSSSLSKTINEEDGDENFDKENIKPKSENIRENPTYKYLRNKNDVIHQNFNTNLNKYEDDSDAGYDSDENINPESENRKETFESQLKMRSKYFINGRKPTVNEKSNSNRTGINNINNINNNINNNNNNEIKSKLPVVSKKVKHAMPVPPALPVRKSSTSNLTKKIMQDSMKTPAAKEKLIYKEKPISSTHMGTSKSPTSPPLRSVSTSSSSSVHATSPLTMYSRVNESLDVEKKPKNYNIVKTEPIMIESKPERVLKYKPPRRMSSSLTRSNKTSGSSNNTNNSNINNSNNKNNQDLSINEISTLVIDAPPERGRSIFKEAREFSNKSHSIDTELSRRGSRREGRNRSPDYRMKPGMKERSSRGRTRNNILRDMEDDDDNEPLILYSKNVNPRSYLKKYLDRREGQRSQSVDASKSSNGRGRGRRDSDEFLKINNDDNEDSFYISEIISSSILEHENDLFGTTKHTSRDPTIKRQKHTSSTSLSSLSSISSTSSSSSSLSTTGATASTTNTNTNTNTTSTTTATTKNASTINNKSFINDAPIDSYYRISGVIKHSVVPIGNPSILYGGEDNYYRSKNTLYNSRSTLGLNRYNYQKNNGSSSSISTNNGSSSNRNSIQSNKRISSSSTTANNEEDTSLIFGNLPEEIYNFLKPELEVPAPTRTSSSRESVQSISATIVDPKHQSISSLHQSLTLNDESDNDEITLKNTSNRLQAAVIREEEVIPKPSTEAQKRMEQITNEILSTERTYVNELRNLVNIYIEPLKRNHLLEEEEFNSVFANIEDIYKFHTKSFLPPLEAVCKNETKISKFFLDVSPSFENFYSKYYYAFNGANTLLTLVQSNNHNVRIPNLSSSSYILNLPLFDRSNKKRLKKFRNFLKNCAARSDHTQLSLQGYLILPVQRLPRYLLLLEQLVKYSKDSPIEKEENERAAELMRNVVASCNSYMKQCEEKHILLEITTKHIRLDSNDSRGEMVDNYIKIQGLVRVPGAKVIRKGDLKILRSVTSDSSIFPCKDNIMNRRLSNEYVGRNPNLINPNIRCSSALSMATTTTSSSSRTYYDSTTNKNNGSRLSSSNESIHSSNTNTTYGPSTTTTSSSSGHNKRSSTSVIDIKKNQTTDSIGMFYLIHNLFIYCKLNGILVNVLDLEDSTVEPASFSSTSSEFVEIESKKTDIVLIVSDSKTQLYLTSPDIESVYSWQKTINKQWRTLKKIEK